MVESTVFIGAVVAGVVQLFKLVRDKNYGGAVVICVAVLVGVLVALLDTEIGVTDISVANGVMLGFAAAGVVAVAEKV
jgi:high-affinity Fe2+/Pb2+ permease